MTDHKTPPNPGSPAAMGAGREAELNAEIDRLKEIMRTCLKLAEFCRDYPENRANAELLHDLLQATLTNWQPPPDTLYAEVQRLRDAICSIQQIVGHNIPPSGRLALVAWICQCNRRGADHE